MKRFEEMSEFTCKKAQECADKILAAINPVSALDAPFVLYSLREIVDALEATMDEEQKHIADILPYILGTRTKVTETCTEEIPRRFDRGGAL